MSNKHYSPNQQRLKAEVKPMVIRSPDKPQRTVQYAKGRYIQVDHDVSDEAAIERAYKNEEKRNLLHSPYKHKKSA